MGTDAAPWQHVTVVSVGALTEALADGRYWIRSITFFNGSGGARHFRVHDHATAATGANPIHGVVPAGETVTVPGPFRFALGVQVQELSAASETTAGVVIVYRPRSVHE